MKEKVLQRLETLAGDDRALDHPEEVQEGVLLSILKRNKNTLFAKDYSFSEIGSAADYTRTMPVLKYSDFEPYINLMKSKTRQVLLAENFPRWAQTSGTLASPKIYPIPAQMAEYFGQTLAKIIVSCIEEAGTKEILQGKMLMMVADVVIDFIAGKPVGYISGIVSHDVQKLEGVQHLFTPPCNVLAMRNLKDRWLEMARCASQENVTMACSTPPILLSYLRKITDEYSPLLGIPDNICALWPNLTLITGSGVRMALYENQYRKLLGDHVLCREFYCATEGFFAYQQDEEGGMIPILDHIFYEFIPLREWKKVKDQKDYRTYEFTRLPYAQCKCNEDYVMLITTPGGLYSYVIGDIIRFVRPNRMVWVGRIGWESNVAGEKLTEMHISLMRKAVEDTVGVEILNNVTAVRYNPLQYVFAFEFTEDVNVDEVLVHVEKSLREINPLYDHLRRTDVLQKPDIVKLNPGTYDCYMELRKKKTGSLGQVKLPPFVSLELIDELKDSQTLQERVL